MQGLENYLRVVTSHEQIKLDPGLHDFLTSQDYKSFRVPLQSQMNKLLHSQPHIS